jgi:hypothetical protein
MNFRYLVSFQSGNGLGGNGFFSSPVPYSLSEICEELVEERDLTDQDIYRIANLPPGSTWKGSDIRITRALK